jgi:hypothetical protein
MAIFNMIVQTQKPFYRRYEGSIIGTRLSADHHHNIPSRMLLKDPFNRAKFTLVHGLHAVMTERQQYASHTWTATTNNLERKAVAEDLHQRYIERGIDIASVIMYLNKCCEDRKWLASMEGLIVLLDNHHLITRFRDHSNGSDRARHSIFMSEIARIITGTNMVMMRQGSEIVANLDSVFAQVRLEDAKGPSNLRIVTTDLESCYDTQKKLLLHCITPPPGSKVTILDRFFLNRCGMDQGRTKSRGDTDERASQRLSVSKGVLNS